MENGKINLIEKMMESFVFHSRKVVVPFSLASVCLFLVGSGQTGISPVFAVFVVCLVSFLIVRENGTNQVETEKRKNEL